VVVAPRGHELTRRDDLTLAEVAQHPLIMLSPDPSRNDDRERLNAALRRAGVSRIENTVLETSNSELIKCYVEAGLGIGIVAESSVMKMRRDLEVIRFGRQLGQTEVGLLVRREKVISKPMRNFFMLLSKDFESWPT
jgi:DNA-binding transcriptional LysR family regulator